VKHVRAGFPAQPAHEEKPMAAELAAQGATAVASQPLPVKLTEQDGLTAEAVPHRLRAGNFVAAAHTVPT